MASEIKIHLGTYLNDSGIKATSQQVDALAKKVKTVNAEVKSGADAAVGSIGKLEGPFGKLQDALGGVVGKAMSMFAAFKIGWDVGTIINDKIITPLFGVRDAEEELKNRNKELRRQADEAAKAWEAAFQAWDEGFRRQVEGLDESISKAERLTAAYLQMQNAREKVRAAEDDAALLGLERDKFNDMAMLARDGNATGSAQVGKYYDVLIAEEKQKQKLAKFDRDAEVADRRRADAQKNYAAAQQKTATIEHQLLEAKNEEEWLDTRAAVNKYGFQGAEERYQKAVKTRERLEKDLAKAQEDRDKRRASLGALNVEATATAQERANLEEQAKLEVDEKKKAYDDYLDEVAKKDEEASTKRASDQAEKAKKAVEEEARERRQMEQRLSQQRLADIRTELSERKRLEAEAVSEQRYREQKTAEAWGWYRDQASMQKEIDEYKAQQAAQKQWEKDFERLKSKRRDWRTAEFGTLSAADESVRQVALAREKEEEADRAVIETAENTRQLAEKLDELLQVKG